MILEHLLFENIIEIYSFKLYNEYVDAMIVLKYILFIKRNYLISNRRNDKYKNE